MRELWPALIAGLALVLVPTLSSTAEAQMDFSEDEADSAGDAGGDSDMSFGEDEAEGTGEGDGSDMAFGEDEAEGTGGEGGGFLDSLDDDGGTETEIEEREAPPETVEEIYAVQQIYALRLNRLEVAPSAAFVVNDPYVSHPAIGVAMNYWFSNVLAIGVNWLWYQFIDSNESDLNFFLRRSTRLAVPITEWQTGLHLNFTYVPFYGKFTMFRKFIFQWDAYVLGGVGLMRTRPIPVIDPEVREFSYNWRVAFNVGIGIRVFLTRWLAAFVEFRNYMYLERFENLDVALGDERTNSNTWLSDSNTFTSNSTVHVGLTIFFPFSFEYRRPK